MNEMIIVVVLALILNSISIYFLKKEAKSNDLEIEILTMIISKKEAKNYDMEIEALRRTVDRILDKIEKDNSDRIQEELKKGF